jgi:dTDP-4-amino-4,6-dideoxygalactose transaminase
VLDSRRFILGAELEAFETEFARYCGVAECVGVASGTDAVELAVRACGIGPGDEVITVSHTFIATALAISAAGATPVFVDVRPDDGLIDLTAAAAAVTDRTRAIVPVHLYGRCADMGPLMALAREHSLRVIEDAAQAHGAALGGRRSGTFGDAGCFSFYPSKNLGALGDAGAVVTDDREVASRLRLLRNYGETHKHEHIAWGRNSRLDDLQAAVLRAKLPWLERWNRRRREHAAEYTRQLAGSSVTTPSDDGDRDVFHLYVVRSDRRSELRRHLDAAGIETQIHYPVPAHAQPAFADLPLRHPLKVTEALARQVLSLPMYPELTVAQRSAVVHAVQTFH